MKRVPEPRCDQPWCCPLPVRRMKDTLLAKVCSGGEPGEVGCGFAWQTKDRAQSGDPATDCPDCGAPRYYDRMTRQEYARRKGDA